MTTSNPDEPVCICDMAADCDGSGQVRCMDADYDCYCPCGCEEECIGCANCDGSDDEDLAESDEDHVP